MLAALTTLVFIASPAASSPELAPPSMTMTSIGAADDPEVIVERGYGTSIVAVDGLGVGMLLLAGATESEGLAYLGLATMAFGPGMVHASKGRGEAALGSMLLRPTAVIGGMYLGAHMEDCGSGDEWCGLGGALLGGLVGYGAAVVLDAGFLARERKTARAPRFTPLVAASSQGAQVGLSGSF